MNKIERSVVWICRHFNREQIFNLIDELLTILDNKNPDLQPKDEFKEKHPKYRDFSVDPLAPLDAAEVVKPKKS